MASATQARLEAAFEAITTSFHRLETAAASLSQKQGEATAELDAALTQAAAENNFLKEDNLRLGNQLQALQRDYLELQSAALSTVNRLDDSVKAIDLILEH
jgi:hypothetical protein